MRGIFEVYNQTKNIREGTAFAIHKDINSNIYTIVTAYHVIAEATHCGNILVLVDSEGNRLPIHKVWDKKSYEEYLKLGHDYLAFLVRTDNVYEVYKTLHHNGIIRNTPCTIEGASSHFSTQFTPFSGIYEGVVTDSDGTALCISVPEGYRKDSQQVISSQEIFHGMSGSPVTIDDGGNEKCIGILSEVGSDYSSPKKYIVPIYNAISQICGLSVNDEADVKHGDLTISTPTFLNLLFQDCDLDEFEFSNDSFEEQAWHKLSNLFFKGVAIDHELKNIITSSDFDHLNPEIKVTLRYYYARLLYKRGRVEDATSIINFDNNPEILSTISAKSKKKILSVSKSRMLIENLPNDSNGVYQIERAGELIEKIDSNDAYKAYEQASLFGKGLTNLFLKMDDLSYSEKKEVLSVYNTQKELYKSFPEKLKKQDVVITCVEWYLELWRASSNLTIDDIEETVIKGFAQSTLNKNTIFHIHCLLALEISYLIKGKNVEAIKLGIIIAKLMRVNNVLRNHEGIQEMIGYIKRHYGSAYEVFYYTYLNYNLSTSELFKMFEKVSSIDLRGSNWVFITIDALNIYNYLYADIHTKPYNIEYSTIKTCVEG